MGINLRAYFRETFGTNKLRKINEKEYITKRREYSQQIRGVESDIDDKKNTIDRRMEELKTALNTYGKETRQTESLVKTIKTDKQGVKLLTLKHGELYTKRANLDMYKTIQDLLALRNEDIGAITDSQLEGIIVEVEAGTKETKSQEHPLNINESGPIKFDPEGEAIIAEAMGETEAGRLAHEKKAEKVEDDLEKELEGS